LLAGFVLLALSALSSPSHALTCPDEFAVTAPLDVTYLLTETGCSANTPGVGADVKIYARVDDSTASVSFFRPGQADPTVVSTSFTTGAGCNNGGTASGNIANYAYGASNSCQITIRLTNGAEFSFTAANDANTFAYNLTNVRFSLPPTTTTLASSPNPSTFGDSVTLSATVSGGVGAPAGNVNFKDGATSLGLASLVDAGGGLSVVSIASGPASRHACAVTTEGGVKCWGQNDEGQLGDGSTSQSAVPIDVQGLSSGVVQVATGGNHSCALMAARTVKCWGFNSYGQLGSGTFGTATPIDVPGLTDVVAIAAGDAHSCALTLAGGVKCWGRNVEGQLGRGTFGTLSDRFPAPDDVATLTSDVRAIAAGNTRTCAIMQSSGAAKCWGDNSAGGVGDNSQTNRNTPTDVTGLSSSVVSIAAGDGHTCAVMADGGINCWGRNFFGQLGATSPTSLVPIEAAPAGSGFVTVSAGSEHNCALTSSGGAKCWGNNENGRLGNGNTTGGSPKVDVAGLGSGVTTIVAGALSTYAVTTGTGAFAWGLNGQSQLGNGTNTESTTPVDVSGLTGGKAEATLVTSLLPGGNRSITATSIGDSDRTGSTSAALAQTVNKAASITVVTASPVSSSTFGQSVTLTATVSSGGGTPGGSVTFSDSVNGVLGTGTLSGGVATLSTAALSAGGHTITATYSGDTDFLTSAGTKTFTVNQASSTTLVSASPASPSTFGQSVTLTATVSSGGGTPTGTVSFSDSVSGALGTGTLSGGVATLSTSGLSVGAHTITATYSGSATILTSTGTRTYTVNKANSTTVVAASPASPSTFGQSVTLTATVSSSGGTPGGTVTFSDSVNGSLGTATLSGGVATLSTTALQVGAHTIMAVYSGSASFATSSATRAYTVNKAASTTVVTASPVSPSSFNQSVTFTATVTSGGGIPSGSVTFKDGATVLGSGTLSAGGVATLSTAVLSVSAHTITATYAGNATILTSTGTLNHTVNKAASTLAVTASPVSPSALGQAVTFTATVSSSGGVPGGTVNFSDDVSGALGTATLSPGGVATLSTSALSFGAHTITATYSGNANILTATGTRSHSVGKAVTTTVLTVSPASPSTFGQSVTLTATVNSAGGVPGGTVSFTDSVNGALGTATLNGSGVATLSTSALSSGGHTFTATYSGAALFLGSPSTGIAHTINKRATTTVLAASPAAASTFGQSVTLTATVTSAAGIPSGSVTFKDGSAVLGTGALGAGGVATFSTAALTGGTHSITASYAGAGNFLASASAGLAYTVNKAATTTTIFASPASSNIAGQMVTFTISAGSAAGDVTGSVIISDSIDGVLGTAQFNVNGFASLSTPTLSVGNHTISAATQASQNFAGSTGTVAYTIGKAPSTALVSASPASPTRIGQATTFTASVEGGVGAPTGQVTLKDGAATLSTAALVAVSSRTVITAIAADNSFGNANLNHVCALTATGGVKCWGANGFGQLGDGMLVDRLVPGDVPALGSGVAALAMGSDHSCALTTAGGVKCWGDGTRGQLGNGGASSTTPVNVTGLTSGVVAIAAGGTHSCALTAIGGVKCWGASSDGAIGDGTLLQRNTPVDVTGLASGVSAISSGQSNVCAIMTASGGVKCWGLNNSSQVGDGTTVNRTTPTNVTGLASGVAVIANGPSHSCAVTTLGAVKCWGQNDSGQVGDGTTNNVRSTPVPLTSLASGVSAVALGSFHSCALMTTGAVKCWGLNLRGQVGDGTTVARPLPVAVVSLGSGVKAIAASKNATFAVTNAGIALSWGDGLLSALGTASQGNRLTPGDVEGLLGGRSTASFTTSALSIAAHSITAVYAGDANRTGVTSPVLAHSVINKAATTTVVTSAPAPSSFGQVVTLTATVSSAGAIPGGTVSFSDSVNGALGTGTLSVGGVATLSTSALSVGRHTITATYSGNATFLASTGTRSQTVNKGATTTVVTSAPAPSSFGQVVTLTATVSSACAIPGGTVSFSDSVNGALGTVTLNAGGAATLSTSALSVGVHTITATYSGNATFLASTGTRSQTVNKGATVTALATSASSVAFGASVTLTATVGVVAPASATPSGSVTFFRAGNISIGTAAVSAGKAVLSTTALPSGANAITARYDVAGADPRLLTSTSAAVSVSVAKRTSTTTLTASKNPAALGTAVTLTATVGTGATGNVVFKNGTATIATVALTNGVATTAFTPSVAGTLPITAAYAGDANFNASTSAALKLIAFASCKDGFAAALPVAGANASVFGTTVGATGETGEPNHAGNSGALNSVWCTWTAPATGTVTIDTTGSSFNTTLGVYTGTSVAGLSQVAANDNIGPGNSQSRVSFAATAGTVYRIAIDGVSATGAYVLNIALAPPAPVTFASVLPTARSIATGATATAFATMINTGAVAATACSLALPPGFPANFSYQITNATNALTGTPDTPVNIAAGAAQGFFLAVTPLVDLNSTELAIVFDCTNTPTTITVPGLNTLLLSASSTPSPDLISIGSTPSGDGIASIPGATGSTAFGAATINIGAAGTITASVDDNGRGLALTALLCVTNPTTGACTNPATPAASATFALAANASATVAVFVTGTGNVPFDPGANRLFLRFKTADGVTRGATSVAVRTQ
jgi:alpha-tubulin suppressor-like RCC1 family protein